MSDHRSTVSAEQVSHLTDDEAQSHYILWLRDYYDAKACGDDNAANYAVAVMSTLCRHIFTADRPYEESADILRALILSAKEFA